MPILKVSTVVLSSQNVKYIRQMKLEDKLAALDELNLAKEVALIKLSRQIANGIRERYADDMKITADNPRELECSLELVVLTPEAYEKELRAERIAGYNAHVASEVR